MQITHMRYIRNVTTDFGWETLVEETSCKTSMYMEDNSKMDLLELECENVNCKGNRGELTRVLNLIQVTNCCLLREVGGCASCC